MTPGKVMCVVRGQLADDAPGDARVTGCALYRPAVGFPAEHPDDVQAIASVWVDDLERVDPPAWFPDAHVDAYLVGEHVQIDYDRDWPDGETSPGLHRMVFVRRAPGLTRDQMAAHWIEHHTPLVRRHHPGFWQYVQNVVVAPVTPAAPEVDGVAEMHFRSAEEMRDRFYDSEEGQQVIGADVRQFLDRASGWRVLASEHWVLTPSARSSPGR